MASKPYVFAPSVRFARTVWVGLLRTTRPSASGEGFQPEDVYGCGPKCVGMGPRPLRQFRRAAVMVVLEKVRMHQHHDSYRGRTLCTSNREFELELSSHRWTFSSSMFEVPGAPKSRQRCTDPIVTSKHPDDRAMTRA